MLEGAEVGSSSVLVCTGTLRCVRSPPSPRGAPEPAEGGPDAVLGVASASPLLATPFHRLSAPLLSLPPQLQPAQLCGGPATVAGHSGGDHRRGMPRGHAVGDPPGRSGRHLHPAGVTGKSSPGTQPQQPTRNTLTPSTDTA